MKRFLVLCGSVLLCGTFVGCGSDTHEDLIKNTIKQIEIAAVDIGNIKSRVNDAIKDTEAGQKFDLTKAIEATKKLKETGEVTQKLKAKIEQVRAQVTDAERKANVESQKAKLNAAFSDLLKAKEELKAALVRAENLPVGNAKQAVKEFREKLLEAEGPFEQLSR